MGRARAARPAGRARGPRAAGRDGHPHRTVWVRGAADLDAFGVLRQEAGLARGADAAPLAVFLGGDDTTSGTFAGMWVVDRLNTRERGLRLGGIPARVDFTLQLTEHVEVEQEAEG